MTTYDNNLTGALFKNDKKEKDTQPDYKGSAEIGGIEYWVAGWIKQGKSGKFMSLKFTDKAAKQEGKGERQPERDTGIPW